MVENVFGPKEAVATRKPPHQKVPDAQAKCYAHRTLTTLVPEGVKAGMFVRKTTRMR